MSSIGPLSPGTVIDDATVGTVAWSNPNNAKVSDGNYSIALPAGGGISHYLKATNFGFSIPIGATINGILVEIEENYFTAGGTTTENAIKIVKSDGTIGTTNKSTGATFPTTDTYISYGSSSDLWGEMWDNTKINDVDFGVVLSVNSVSSYSNAAVDHIRITVYYTEAPSIVSPFPSFFRSS